MYQMKARLVFLFISFFVFGCSNKYQKTLKNSDPAKKLELAQFYYNKKDYFRASTLFEQLQDAYSGTATAEKVTYYSAYCNYGMQNNLLAGYQFKTYYENFPTGVWAEECLYMYAHCLYLESQVWYLDQTDTYKALEAIKLFVGVYSDSKYIPECNIQLDKLRNKLAYKAYKNAKMYFQTREYKSAIISLQNVIKDFPEIPQKEELDFLTVKSYFLLFENSIDKKKDERYSEAVLNFQQFKNEYPDSKFMFELKKLSIKAETIIKTHRIKNDASKEKDEQKS